MRRVTESQAMDILRELNDIKDVSEIQAKIAVLEQYVYHKLDNAKLLAEANAKIVMLEKLVLKAKYGELLED